MMNGNATQLQFAHHVMCEFEGGSGVTTSVGNANPTFPPFSPHFSSPSGLIKYLFNFKF